jgi:isoleucyl-tRNA synthetase
VESPVDQKGQFTKDFGSALPLKGRHVLKSNQPIVEHLEAAGHLRGKEEHAHSYPHCWRCKKPVIFRSTPQWFLKIDHQDLRRRVLAVISDPHRTSWYPEGGKNRILGMMEARPDWCLSRQRLWGVPLPIAYCAECREPVVSGGLKTKVLEIFEKEGSDAWFERPPGDFLGPDEKCAKCGSGNLTLERDILDVWFDSGVSHQAVLEKGA